MSTSKSTISTSNEYNCAFALCVEGAVTIQSKLTTEVLMANHIIPVSHSDCIFSSPENGASHCFVFSKNILNGMPSHLVPIYTHIINRDQVKIRPDQVEQLLTLNGLLEKKRLEESDLYNQEVIKNIELAMLNEIYSIYQSCETQAPTVRNRKQLVNSFFDLVMKHFRNERQTAFYADKLCLTPKYLSLVIKQLTSKSASQWINETLIAEIKLMLKTSDMTAQQISDHFNFPNSSFFGRFFKQHTGKTTKEYRLSA